MHIIDPGQSQVGLNVVLVKLDRLLKLPDCLPVLLGCLRPLPLGFQMVEGLIKGLYPLLDMINLGSCRLLRVDRLKEKKDQNSQWNCYHQRSTQESL